MNRYQCVLALIALLAPVVVYAQGASSSQLATESPAGSQAQTVKNAEFLDQVTKRNNLERDDVQPWHIKAKYELYDQKGNPQATGTYEEWWVNSKKNKHTFADSNFSRTYYFTDDGVFRIDTGKLGRIMGPQRIKLLVRPLSEENFDDFRTEIQDQKLVKAPVKCITLTWRKGAPLVPIKHAYCFDSDSLALRMAVWEYGLENVLYNDVVRFGGQYVAKEIQMLRGKWTIGTIRVEQIERLQDTQAAQVAPPADAEKLPPGLTGFAQPIGTIDDLIVRRVMPPQRPEGDLQVEVTVDKDGRVTDRKVLSGGPSDYAQAVLDAVKLWQFKPTVANHQTVQVNVIIHFPLSGVSQERVFQQ